MLRTMGSRIKERRIHCGFTLEQLAEECDTSKSHVWDLENEKCTRPSATLVAKLAKVLLVDLDYFLTIKLRPGEKEDAVDLRFYKWYKAQPDATKRKIRQVMRIIAKGEQDNDEIQNQGRDQEE